MLLRGSGRPLLEWLARRELTPDSVPRLAELLLSLGLPSRGARGWRGGTMLEKVREMKEEREREGKARGGRRRTAGLVKGGMVLWQARSEAWEEANEATG